MSRTSGAGSVIRSVGHHSHQRYERTIISVLILGVVCAICSLATYRLAYNTGFAPAKELQKGTFVKSGWRDF